MTEHVRTIDDVRRLALRTLELVPDFRRDGTLPERPEENAPDDLPYRRECLGVCQLVCGAATQLGYRVSLVLGAFQDETDPEPVTHAWIEVDEVIIDPTSAQYGLEPVAVIRSEDPRRAWYQPQRKVEGDDVFGATLD